jgi:hypothetical protein
LGRHLLVELAKEEVARLVVVFAVVTVQDEHGLKLQHILIQMGLATDHHIHHDSRLAASHRNRNLRRVAFEEIVFSDLCLAVSDLAAEAEAVVCYRIAVRMLLPVLRCDAVAKGVSSDVGWVEESGCMMREPEKEERRASGRVSVPIYGAVQLSRSCESIPALVLRICDCLVSFDCGAM